MTAAASRLNVVPPSARGLSRVEAARYVGVSPVTFDKLIVEGKMPKAKQIGARRVWDVRRLDLAFDALPGDDDVTDDNPWNGGG